MQRSELAVGPHINVYEHDHAELAADFYEVGLFQAFWIRLCCCHVEHYYLQQHPMCTHHIHRPHRTYPQHLLQSSAGEAPEVCSCTYSRLLII